MCPAICRTLNWWSKNPYVPPARITVETLRWNITMAPGHSGVGGAWGPEYKLGDLSLLKPDNQALSVKRGLIQKGRVMGLRSWMGGCSWAKFLFGFFSEQMTLEGGRIEWIVLEFQNQETLWSRNGSPWRRKWGVGMGYLKVWQIRKNYGFCQSVFSFYALRKARFESLCWKFCVCVRAHTCIYNIPLKGAA